MPRKKKAHRPDPVLTGCKDDVLWLLMRMPPDEILQACQTDDQRQHWINQKLAARVLREYMQAYFTGTAPPTFNNVPQDRAEQMKAMCVYYLDFYAMVFHNWEIVAKYMENAPSTPGQVLIDVITADQIDMMRPAFMNCFKYVPDRHRKHSSLDDSLRARKISLDEYQQQSRQLWQDTGFDQFSQLAGRVYAHIVQNQHLSDERGRSAIKQFLRSFAELERRTLATIHPRKRVRTVAFSNGELLF